MKMFKVIITIFFLSLLIVSCNDYNEYYTYIQRYTGLEILNKKIEIISINDNFENYLTVVMKLESNKLTEFEFENSKYKTDCLEIDVFLEMYDKKYQERVKNANAFCFKTINNKFWQMKIDTNGNMFLEIWY